tara:strand:+ start:72 stop:674 length:603 start_codon:yes stop_codon:yes gene_type:complete
VEGEYMKYQICCDMDGVLCDFAQGAVKLINDRIKNKELIKNLDPKLYRMIDEAEKEAGGLVTLELIRINSPYRKIRDLMKRLVTHNVGFWANLDWIEGGPEIWNAIKDHNPYILSAPMKNSEESMAGKRQWIQKNLKPVPKKIILDDNKGSYTHFGDKTGLLIDDMFFNIKNYRDAGGKAIWSKNWRQTIKILDSWIKKG